MKRTLSTIFLLMLVGCMRNPAPPAAEAKEYQMHGEVIGMDPQTQVATVKHDKIDGFMEAMTMEYPVKDKAEFAKIKVGEVIDSKIVVQGTDYWIATVNPVGAAKPTNEETKKK